MIPFPDLSCSALLKSFRVATFIFARNLENLEIKKCKLIPHLRRQKASEQRDVGDKIFKRSDEIITSAVEL